MPTTALGPSLHVLVATELFGAATGKQTHTHTYLCMHLRIYLCIYLFTHLSVEQRIQLHLSVIATTGQNWNCKSRKVKLMVGLRLHDRESQNASTRHKRARGEETRSSKTTENTSDVRAHMTFHCAA